MKLVQFWKDNAPALGLMTEGGIVDVAAEGARRGFAVPTTMEEAIAPVSYTHLDVYKRQG